MLFISSFKWDINEVKESKFPQLVRWIHIQYYFLNIFSWSSLMWCCWYVSFWQGNPCPTNAILRDTLFISVKRTLLLWSPAKVSHKVATFLTVQLIWDFHADSRVSFCFSYFSVAAIKQHDQKQLKEELTLAYSPRKIEPIMAGKAWPGIKSRKLADHIFIHTQVAERERKGSGLRL